MKKSVEKHSAGKSKRLNHEALQKVLQFMYTDYVEISGKDGILEVLVCIQKLIDGFLGSKIDFERINELQSQLQSAVSLKVSRVYVYGSLLEKKLVASLTNSEDADIILKSEFDGRSFPAHKVVLCARCEYFRVMLVTSGLAESQSQSQSQHSFSHPLIPNRPLSRIASSPFSSASASASSFSGIPTADIFTENSSGSSDSSSTGGPGVSTPERLQVIVMDGASSHTLKLFLHWVYSGALLPVKPECVLEAIAFADRLHLLELKSRLEEASLGLVNDHFLLLDVLDFGFAHNVLGGKLGSFCKQRARSLLVGPDQMLSPNKRRKFQQKFEELDEGLRQEILPNAADGVAAVQPPEDSLFVDFV